MNKKACYAMVLYSFFVCLAGFSCALAAEDHFLIKPVPKSFLEDHSEHKEHTFEFPFYNQEINDVDYRPITGTLHKLTYRIFGKDPQRVDGIYSAVEIVRFYRMFAIENRGEIMWESGQGGRLCFKLPDPKNNDIWCLVSTRDGFYELDIVEKDIPETEQHIARQKMKKEIDEKGRITIYSILFDFNSHVLKKTSLKPLKEIADLLAGHPNLQIEIQGHTDNQGDDAYNFNLSKRRAEAVRQSLVGHGINPLRLTAEGYGSTKPVAPNNSPEGRLQNRRVVLVEK